MSLRELNKRSLVCELCTNQYDLAPFTVEPREEEILACKTCIAQIENPELVDPNHWRCLNDSMWSTVPAVQVVAWRMLTRLKNEGWPQDLLDMMYMEEETLEWAKATGEHIEEDENTLIHRDSNGTRLEAGDSVVLIKDLDVKGANFTAKRGEFMRNISLVHDNEEHIEGRIQGQQVVIVTKWTKKSN
ncbi:PhnA domain-containing protein [Dokdonia sp. Hel_I_53]|uniref:PhnA domain-containing protein n=1 Tax=Dokdonia sp. Hel_I_53 TaxID=1566287 RepID=UPI00119B2825|nr:alkylphosphonate utilization protein [Dokdonia sp. Hel_I_53]TVZ51763.1 phosphonoacetate hydrolase [Dokdonia sp. Hel_I_53]